MVDRLEMHEDIDLVANWSNEQGITDQERIACLGPTGALLTTLPRRKIHAAVADQRSCEPRAGGDHAPWEYAEQDDLPTSSPSPTTKIQGRRQRIPPPLTSRSRDACRTMHKNPTKPLGMSGML
jgi:hypothetical protein